MKAPELRLVYTNLFPLSIKNDLHPQQSKGYPPMNLPAVLHVGHWLSLFGTPA